MSILELLGFFWFVLLYLQSIQHSCAFLSHLQKGETIQYLTAEGTEVSVCPVLREAEEDQ